MRGVMAWEWEAQRGDGNLEREKSGSRVQGPRPICAPPCQVRLCTHTTESTVLGPVADSPRAKTHNRQEHGPECWSRAT